MTLASFLRDLPEFWRRFKLSGVAPGAFHWIQTRDQALFEVVSCGGDAPSEEDLRAFEREAGFRLPKAFRRFTRSPLGGLYVAAREEVWPRAKAFDVGPFWSFLHGVKVFGIAAGIPEWLDIRVQTRAMREEGFAGLVPFLQREGDADKYCFDRWERIVRWDHEQPDALEVVDEEFPALLHREIRELEERTRRRMRGEHQAAPPSPPPT